MIPIPVLDPASVHRTRLANGLTVIVRREPSAPVVAIVTYVKAGYFDEADEVAGISHVLEHMFFKGTPGRGVGEISRETKAAGGYLNAGTIYDHTSYYTVLPSSSFARGLEIQADAYAHSLIEAGELSKELEVIIQEARRKADTPGAVALESMYCLLHDRHRMRRWRIGTEDVLRRMTRDDLMGFYRTYYRPSNTILAIVGDIDEGEALRAAAGAFGEIPDASVPRDRGPSENGSSGFRYREMAGDINQAQLVFGWRTPGATHADTPLLDLAASVLGAGRASRLYRAVRERTLAASVSAFNYTPTDLGVFAVHAEGPAGATAEAARAIWAQIAELREAGVERDELWRTRRLIEARWIRRLETAEGQANYLAEWEAEGDWKLGDRYLERLLVPSESHVTEAIRRYITPDRAAVVVYRPQSAPPLASSAGRFLELLNSGRPEPLPTSPPRTPAAPAIHLDEASLAGVEGGIYLYRTRNDVPILVRPKGGAPLAHIGVYAAGGAVEETEDRAGLTLLLTRGAIKGTARRTAEQIAEDAELLGGTIHPHTGPEHFGWSLSVPSPYADAALDLLADVIQCATYPDEAVEIERSVAEAEVRRLGDDMGRYPMRLLTQAAYAGHPYGVPVGGSEASLAAISPDEIRRWHEMRVLEGPLVVGVVGAVTPNDVANLAARAFRRLLLAEQPNTPPAPWPSSPVTATETRSKAQTALALAFQGPGRRDPERFAAEILAGITSGLGGRFFEELREKRSLAYSVFAYPVERVAGGMFAAYIATSPEREEEARQALLAEFAALR
ncbi:MAG TPA: pitrilysin family protein, partial [Gemmatimonadaceae bacterium]|nr:pitrilysin family protein [Gemmatimonadaceae bacterium]